MDESAIMRRTGWNGIYGDDGKSRIATIKVTGYDTTLPADEIKSSLIKHFGSCGKINCLCVLSDPPERCALIDFVGEGAEEKALKLSGSGNVGGWIVQGDIFPGAAANNLKRIRKKGSIQMFVWVYDSKLTDDDAKKALIKHFASCGEITDVFVTTEDIGPGGRRSVASIYLKGEGASDKALELSGSEMQGCKLIVEAPPAPAQPPPGVMYGCSENFSC